jgi:hypothetical protein
MGDPWRYNYRSIKELNVFFENIEAVPTPNNGDEEWKNVLTGQAHFLRAYFYCQLYSLFGRVPIIDYTFPLGTTEFNETRAPLEEVEAFIVSECDKAIALLPVEQTGNDFGRATKGAAMALKARTLLLAASPLFDSSYPNRAKWEAASAANKAVIDLGAYSLKPISNAADYTNLFQDRNNPETIFQKLFDNQRTVGAPPVVPANTPSGPGKNFGGWGVLQPTHNLVEKFQKNDGSKYVRGTENEYPWADRDLRLYATIILDGSLWGYGADEREVEYFVAAAGADGNKVVDGQDSREGPGWWNATQTGYLVKKWLNPNHDYTGSIRPTTPGIVMRLAEFYLNYAECQIELGNNAEALKYINLIRARALMPPATGANIRADFEYERQIELLFEGQRWFDLRRWKRMAQNYSEPVLGLDIVKYNDGSKRYVVKPDVMQTRTFRGDHQYWAPIPRAELRRAPNLDPAPYE